MTAQLHSYSSPFWPPPIFFYYTQNTRAYQFTHPFQSARTALRVAFLSCELVKAQVDISVSLHYDTVTKLPIRLAWLVRTFANHLQARPLCCWWLITLYTGGNRRYEAAGESQHTGLTTQKGKHFIFLWHCWPHYPDTKFFRRAVSASVHLLSMGLTSHLFAVSGEVNGHTMDRITWGSLESLYFVDPSSHPLSSLLLTKPLLHHSLGSQIAK